MGTCAIQPKRRRYTFSLFVLLMVICYVFLVKERSAKFELDVFNTSQFIEQNDSALLEIIRKSFLNPPSTLAYNLTFKTGDPSAKEGQNKYAMEIFKNMTGGFFVECGAWNGETLSTTLVLERDFGWNGFLCEPNFPSYVKLLSKNRKAWTANICLSTTNRPTYVDFAEYPQNGLLTSWSSIKSYIPIKNKEEVKLRKVPCFPIFSMLSAIGVSTVDFFTLDIEGAELEVLKTIPFDSVLIKIFSIEYNHVPEGKMELRRFVESKGYRFIKELNTGDARDLIFVHESVPLPASLRIPNTHSIPPARLYSKLFGFGKGWR